MCDESLTKLFELNCGVVVVDKDCNFRMLLLLDIYISFGINSNSLKIKVWFFINELRLNTGDMFYTCNQGLKRPRYKHFSYKETVTFYLNEKV
jgi:hypothetical protein